MGKFFKDLKAGLEEAIAYEKGLLDLRSELVEVPEPPAENKPFLGNFESIKSK